MVKEKMVVLLPRSNAAKLKLGYHGDKWFHRGIQNSAKYREPGNYLRLLSRDGKKFLFVKEKDDPDFEVHLI